MFETLTHNQMKIKSKNREKDEIKSLKLHTNPWRKKDLPRWESIVWESLFVWKVRCQVLIVDLIGLSTKIYIAFSFQFSLANFHDICLVFDFCNSFVIVRFPFRFWRLECPQTKRKKLQVNVNSDRVELSLQENNFNFNIFRFVFDKFNLRNWNGNDTVTKERTTLSLHSFY